MKNYLFTALIVIFLLTDIHAEIRFVSKTGNSKPPYTSWATAADSIQKAINICKPGDTVYVGNGVYKQRVFINNGITLIGSGMDSCIIDTREMEKQWSIIDIVGWANVSGFSLFSSTKGGGIGIFVDGRNELCKFENNRFEYCDSYAIAISQCPVEIRNNIIYSKERGIDLSGSPWYPYSIIENNYFNGKFLNIYIPFQLKIIIRHNTFYLDYGTAIALTGSAHDTMFVYNNLVIAKSASNGLGQSNRPSTKINNLIIGNFKNMAMTGYEGYNNIKNNIILSETVGIYNWEGSGKGISNNNSWGGKNNYLGFIPDSTNMSVDPMVVNADTANYDFHLQKYSPMIDAGDPTIIDVDGTMSDIGLYGGPYGESYTYKDLAPRPPRGVSGSFLNNKAMLNWVKNTEADFCYYTVYRDTVPDFKIDSSKMVTRLYDTVFSESVKPGKNYYYKLTASDKQENESKASEQTGIITDVNETRKVVAEDYILYQNYPNPFNPSTIISYKMAKAGRVRIVVYDIKGAFVTEVENSYKTAGFYEVEFTGITRQETDFTNRIASGIYFYRIEIKDENSIPLYNHIRKMLLLK